MVQVTWAVGTRLRYGRPACRARDLLAKELRRGQVSRGKLALIGGGGRQYNDVSVIHRLLGSRPIMCLSMRRRISKSLVVSYV